MLANNLIAVLALTAGASAAATKRARTCTFELSRLRTQNPVGGGDNTLSCFAKLDYGDGRNEKLIEKCYDIVRSGCYNSQLPNRICVDTNHALSDGYIDYGKEYRDFNEDGCTKTGYANPAGDHVGVKCSFPCS